MIFYQSNFCPECGTGTGPRKWWRHRYFCDYCAKRLRRRWDYVSAGLAAGGIVVGSWLSGDHRRASPVTAISTQAPVAAVSAMDARVQLKPAASASPTVLFTCNARTKKGTPCRRKVNAAGERCFQHQGMKAVK